MTCNRNIVVFDKVRFKNKSLYQCDSGFKLKKPL